eukprot:jgi/Botrbrau1/22013/Bobra.0024s0027.3
MEILERQRSYLLERPADTICLAYLTSLIESRRSGLRAVMNSNGKGKGLYASQDFNVGDVVISEEPVVANQHVSNMPDAFVCCRCLQFLGPIEAQIAHVLQHNAKGTVDDAYRTSLAIGESTLPYSSRFPLPLPVSCQGSCNGAVYCNEACSSADWESGHARLCPGSNSPLSIHQREAMKAFTQHATDTNDIFFLVAKVIANVLSGAAREVDHICASFEGGQEPVSQEVLDRALQKAWLPYHVGCKVLWWEGVAIPSDVEDAASFRQELQDLAAESLQLLTEAIYDSRFPGLFTLEVYGSLIGMFELNNIGMMGNSPIEDYFMFVHMDQDDDVSRADREAAKKITGNFFWGNFCCPHRQIFCMVCAGVDCGWLLV